MHYNVQCKNLADNSIGTEYNNIGIGIGTIHSIKLLILIIRDGQGKKCSLLNATFSIYSINFENLSLQFLQFKFT